MLDPQASRFWQAAVFSGLMDVEGLTACWNAIPPAKRDAPEHIDRRLARQAVQSNSLTLWQAQQLLAGRTGGFKVDRYVLLDMIGQGGMGRVYLARDTRLNRRVALKILAPERINNPRAVARFQREARVGAQLQHENLVRVYDFGEANGRFFLVMEFIEGKTIGQLISEQGPMPAETAARLVRQVAMGLGHAHSKGMIHRDVNPYNIMVTHDGIAKLADLGLAIDLTEGDRVTREGATVGTFDYVAPEQARHSHSADIRSDIYSLGCTLYHMLASQVPFPSPSLPEKLFSHQALEPTPLEQLVPGLPEGLLEIVRKMMRKSPDERFANPTQVIQALEPYIEEHPGYGLRMDPVRPAHRVLPEGPPRPDQAVSFGSGKFVPHSRSPQPDEAGSIAMAATADQPARDAPRAETIPSGPSQSPPRTAGAGEASTLGSDLDDPSIPILTPVDELAEEDGHGSLFVDLGPELPLSDRLARSKPRLPVAIPPSPPVPDPIPAEVGSNSWSSTTDGSVWWPSVGWLWGMVAVALFATLLFVLIGLTGQLPAFLGLSREPAHSLKPRSSQGLEVRKETRQPEADIVLRPLNPDEGVVEKAAPPKNLAEAMRSAVGSSSFVELRNRKPLLITAQQISTLDSIGSGRGSLDVRGAPGFAPVIQIEMSAVKPFLATGSAVKLALSGLDIQVLYPPTSAGAAVPAPPVISAAGSVKIVRCAFSVKEGPKPVGCRALEMKGNPLMISGCWFQGFDRAIQFHSFPRAQAEIDQTMIVPGSDPSSDREWRAWGVEVRLEAGGGDSRTPRRLILRNCTFEGSGLLDFVPGMVQSGLQVELKHCAVRAGALLAWKPEKPEDRLAAPPPVARRRKPVRYLPEILDRLRQHGLAGALARSLRPGELVESRRPGEQADTGQAHLSHRPRQAAGLAPAPSTSPSMKPT